MLVTLSGIVMLIRLYMMYIYKHREKKEHPSISGYSFSCKESKIT